MSGEGPFLFSFFKKNPDDIITEGSPLINPEDETGMDRLRTMFSLDQYGYRSKEISLITQNSLASTFCGSLIGAIIHSKEAYRTFLENNEATKFLNHLEAKRELQRVMYLAISKGAFRWGWRIGGFTLTYMSTMTMVSVYWGKESVLDYVIAGGLTGGLFRATMGLKGIVAGTIVGSVIGAIGGTTTLLVLKAGGVSMDDLREFSKTLHVMRQEKIKEGIKEQMVKEYTDFTASTINDESFKNLEVSEEV